MKKLISVKEKLTVCGAIGIAAALATSCSHSGRKEAVRGVPTIAHGSASPESKHSPFITSQPVDVAADSGQQATFSIVAEGNGLSYQWHARKKKSDQFEPLPNGTQADLTFQVTDADFGLYYCAVGGEDDRGYLSISRIASLGGVPSGDKGIFVPIDNPVTAGTVTTICGHTVSGHWDQFPGTETPPSGTTGLQCQILNITASPNAYLNTNTYILQWWVTAVNTGCMTNVLGTTNTVGCPINPIYKYKFIAHFIIPPADGTVLELQGTWTHP
jgi:hypothetical protein